MSFFTLFSFLYLCVSYFYSYIMTLSLSRVRALSETLAMLACVGGATTGVAGARRRAPPRPGRASAIYLVSGGTSWNDRLTFFGWDARHLELISPDVAILSQPHRVVINV